MTVEEFIEASLGAKTVDELFGIYQKAMSQLGYDRLIFSLMTDHLSIGRKAGHGIISNYPDDWMKYYVEKNFAPLDPVRGGMFATVGPFLWDDMETSQPLTRQQARFMSEGREAGLFKGVGIPLRGVLGAIAGIGAASSNSQIDTDLVTLSKLNLISQQFYTVFLALEGGFSHTENIRLSDREREILQWSANGQTRKQIANTLGISPSTVDVHANSILKKFKTGNMTVAAFRAVNMYLIQL